MNRMLLEGERKALQSRLDVLNRINSNCHTCIKLEHSGYCQQHKSIVPDDFKTTGCDEWEWDDIPFNQVERENHIKNPLSVNRTGRVVT